VRFHTDFDPQKHQLSDKYWSEERQKWRARNQMQWFLREVSNVVSLDRMTF
jgi:hypothetical protein